MSLKIRRQYFNNLAKKIDCKKINDLMLEIKIPDGLYNNIAHHCKLYISKCIDQKNIILDEKRLLQKLKINKKKIQNITPNGMVVPKNEFSLEFNLLVRSYVDIIQSLNINNLISNFHFPPNIRVKFSKADESNLKRKHPTEDMHSDTWTGANPNWVAAHIFLLGDTGNCIRYAYPPNNFKEDWLKPLKSSNLGKIISRNYNIIKYIPKKSTMILADATIIHQSYRNNNAGIRISLDTGFDLKMPKLKSFKKVFVSNVDVKNTRLKETITNKQFLGVSKKSYFHFPDKIGKKVYSKGGFKHPSNVKVIKLEN